MRRKRNDIVVFGLIGVFIFSLIVAFLYQTESTYRIDISRKYNLTVTVYPEFINTEKPLVKIGISTNIVGDNCVYYGFVYANSSLTIRLPEGRYLVQVALEYRWIELHEDETVVFNG